MLEERSEHKVKASNAWEMLPSSASLQRNLGFSPWRDVLKLRKCFRLKCLFVSVARASWSLKLFLFFLLRKVRITCKCFSDFLSHGIVLCDTDSGAGKGKNPQKCFHLCKSSFHLLSASRRKLNWLLLRNKTPFLILSFRFGRKILGSLFQVNSVLLWVLLWVQLYLHYQGRLTRHI